LQALPECLDISKGSALILCTSKKMVRALSEGLQQSAKNSTWNLLTQDGSTTPASLAKKFTLVPYGKGDSNTAVVCALGIPFLLIQ
jgi:Rad3-related DNA helicase